MKVLITGSGGLIGQHLVQALEHLGHEIIRLVRDLQDAESTVILWNPTSSSMVNPERLEALDAVIHLAGENIADERWTPEKKMRIRNSRVQGTGLLAASLADLAQRPRVFICASATGYYGDQGAQECNEMSLGGDSFLAGVCRDWESATRPAADTGIRTVQLRLGMILSSSGGALEKMKAPFRLGLGGVIGNGRQYWSWISLEDAVRAIVHVLYKDDLSGPVNLVSPNPSTNRDFTRALGKALKRPTLFPMPTFAARALMGEMAHELMLGSARVVPTRLIESGFNFQDPDLAPLLKQLMEKQS